MVELNGQSVSSLTGFLEMARTLPHGANVRLKTCDLNGKVRGRLLCYGLWAVILDFCLEVEGGPRLAPFAHV